MSFCALSDAKGMIITMMKNIEEKRRILADKFPDMLERTVQVSDKVIEIAYEMLSLDNKELEAFEKHLEQMVK